MTFEHNAFYLVSIHNKVLVVIYQLDLRHYSKDSNKPGFGYVNKTLDGCTHCTFDDNEPPYFVKVIGKISEEHSTLTPDQLQTIYPELFI